RRPDPRGRMVARARSHAGREAADARAAAHRPVVRRRARRGDDDRDPRCLQCQGQARAAMAPGASELAAGLRDGVSDRARMASLPRPWIRLGVDDLVDALPPSGGGIDFGAHGEVAVGETFRAIEGAWMTGVAAMARAGARIILDDVFLAGAASQQRTRTHLAGLAVLWIGVRCDAEIAAGREGPGATDAPGPPDASSA